MISLGINIGKKISARRRALGISQMDLASRLRFQGVDVTNQAVSKWEKGATLPNAQQFLILCSVLDIRDVMEEFCGTGSTSILSGLDETGRKKALEYIRLLRLSGLYSQDIPETEALRRLPLYSIAVSAGTGQFLDMSGYELIEADDSVPAAASYAVRISGDSMEPRFSDGQIVWVKKQDTLSSGDIGVFLYDDNAYIKEFRRGRYGVSLVSLNPEYEDIIVDSRSELRVLGRVLK